MTLRTPALLLLGLNLVLLSCAGPRRTRITTPDKTTWKLAFITGLDMDISGLYPRHRPTLLFDNEKETLYIDTGCNSLAFGFKASGNGLSIRDQENIERTSCPGPAEPHLLYQLKAVDSFSVSDNGLFLYGRKRPLLHFKAL